MRTTNQHVNVALREFTDLLSSEARRPVAVTLHRGNGSYKISNVLIVDGTNLWPENTGGCTANDAYRALRTMIASIGLLSDIREGDRLRRGTMLLPEWDAESGRYGLSDCKHWGTPGPGCSGPRVGITRDNVILCEGHYNSKP